MTVPHHTSPLAAPSVEAAVALLRARGLRVSSARRLVIEALFAAERPLTAETRWNRAERSSGVEWVARPGVP